MSISRALVVLCALGAGCAFMPREHWQLTQARVAYSDLRADTQGILLAPREVAAAGEALASAERARDTLDDPAVVDHLSYLAKQRAYIAREAVQQGKDAQ